VCAARRCAHSGTGGRVLGADFNYASGDGNYYAGDTGWHPDGNWGQLFACKVAFYLAPLTADTGALRVIPGSQRPDHFIRTDGIDPNQAQDLFGVPASEFPGRHVLESQPGDVVIFNHDLYHAAFGGGNRRKMFTMNLTRHCVTPEDQQTLHKYLSVHLAGGYNVDTGAGMYYPTMLDTANEARMQHLQQCATVHDEFFPQYARAR
jgi:ectoine hydroxylase-related dioxygenase (phytanoyl-CoA dioxygenase family)